MSGNIKPKYQKLNFNLKRIIFNHLPLIQIFDQITKIDKSSHIALKKNHALNFLKNNYILLKENISGFNSESIDQINSICTYFSSLAENEIYAIIVYLFAHYFYSLKKLNLRKNYLGLNLNEKKMMYFSECLKINTSIQNLCLGENC